MARTERPQLRKDGMLHERSLDAAPVEVADLTGFAALRRVAESVDANATVEYWKSVPYFINFMDGYQLADRVRDRLSRPPPERRSWSPSSSARSDLIGPRWKHFGPIDLGNGRLRALAAETVGQGWWRLLWVPPSMPYLTPAGPYADAAVQGMTKRLIFSSWSAAPTAIASLLSYEAERQLVAGHPADQQYARSARGDRHSPGLQPARRTCPPRCRHWPCSGRTPAWPRWPTRSSSRGLAHRPDGLPHGAEQDVVAASFTSAAREQA